MKSTDEALARKRAEHPGRKLASLLQRLDTMRRAAEHRRGALNPAERRLLWLLSDGTKRTLREIAEELSLEQSTVNRQVNGAARAGLVEILEGHPARLVRASDLGTDRFNADVVEILDGYSLAFAEIGDGEAHRLETSLESFVVAYENVVNSQQQSMPEAAKRPRRD